MFDWKEFKSTTDKSVNWTRSLDDGGMLECRYVRRVEDYFIAYVSSHSGCKHACRFCHLTQTGQTMFTPAKAFDVINQYMTVLGHYDRLRMDSPAKRVNVNFMARGEPLSNEGLLRDFRHVSDTICREALRRDLTPKINVSSIFPVDMPEIDLADVFRDTPSVLYWSLYSLDPKFRRRWLPRAQAPERVMERLLKWQAKAEGRVVLHWALIDGENDSDQCIAEICDFVARSGLRAKLNLVRYNPHSPKTGREASDERYARALHELGRVMAVSGSRIVPRVGPDVKASCGMFMTAEEVA